MTTKLESLANELLFNIFDYISMGQIFSSFQSLNSRFNQLIDANLRTTRHLDFRFMSLSDSNIFFQSQLSKVMNEIISITISNENGTPLQIEFFRCNDFRFRQFINLRSLSLYHIHSQKIMMETALELDYLPHLISINLTDCCGINQSLINTIWKMPKLIHCSLSTRSCGQNQHHCPSVISSSLKYVSIQDFYADEQSLFKLVEYTPHLRCLYIYSDMRYEYTTMPLLSSLIKFEFNENRSSIPSVSIGNDRLETFLQKVPNLRYLTVNSLSMFMDGYQWENIITNYLPKLKIFRCTMVIRINTLGNLKETKNNLLCSFQSQFWLRNDQWFIRCYLKSENQRGYYILYQTLPYFLTPSIANTDYLWSASTCPAENDYWLSDSVYDSFLHVNSLTEMPNTEELNTNETTSPRRTISFRERIINIFRLNLNGTEDSTKKSLGPSLDITRKMSDFINTSKLDIKLPFKKHFSKDIPKLYQLTLLNVQLTTDYTNQSDLRFLLEQTPNLHTLSVLCPTKTTLKYFLVAINSRSILKLNLPKAVSLTDGIFYNIEQCAAFSHSALGKQCEILTIIVQNKECIVHLINEMNNLRLLIVDSFDENYLASGLPYRKCPNLFAWLKFTLPSTIKIAKYDCCEERIRLWIR
jgi:hypothetical protein